MFSYSTFKVSFHTTHITGPFEIIFDEINNIEIQFSNLLKYNYSILFYFIFRKLCRCSKSTHWIINLFPTDLKCKHYGTLNPHLYLCLFFSVQFCSINLSLHSCVRHPAKQFTFIISLSYSNFFLLYPSRLIPLPTYSALSGFFWSFFYHYFPLRPLLTCFLL